MFESKQCQIEALFVGMPRNATPALRETLRVAVVASRTNFGATGDRVPRRVRPLNV